MDRPSQPPLPLVHRRLGVLPLPVHAAEASATGPGSSESGVSGRRLESGRGRLGPSLAVLGLVLLGLVALRAIVTDRAGDEGLETFAQAEPESKLRSVAEPPPLAAPPDAISPANVFAPPPIAQRLSAPPRTERSLLTPPASVRPAEPAPAPVQPVPQPVPNAPPSAGPLDPFRPPFAPAPWPAPATLPPAAALVTPQPRYATEVPVRAPELGLPAMQPVAPASIVSPPVARSAEQEAIAAEADGHVREGFRLASVRAYHSAKQEMVIALRLVAQSLDAAEGSSKRGAALAAGLRALKEADDFVPHGAALEAELDVRLLVGAHQTPVLRERDLAAIQPLAARQEYYAFAQRQLTAAVMPEVAGSMALHGLGKLYVALGEAHVEPQIVAASKAMVLQAAALEAQPDNALAANELAVLQARAGRYSEARQLLTHALRLAPLPEAWHNLAVVCRRSGDELEARRAEEQHQVARRAAPASRALGVNWVSPQELSRNADAIGPSPAAAATAVRPDPAPAAKVEAKAKSGWGWLDRLK